MARRAREEGEAQRILSLTSHEHMRRAARLLAAIATDEGQLERLRQEAQIELLFALAKDVTHMRGPILR